MSAIEEELKSLKDNNTWTIVKEIPRDRKPINSMWLFTIKDDGSERYKARLVAKGCSQRPGLDYGETFAPVAKITTVRCLLSIAVRLNWWIHQMDVKTAFLNGVLEEVVFMKLPPGIGLQSNLCKLNKSIYGLKQLSRSWNLRFDNFITNLRFKRLDVSTERGLYIILYVDDILIFGQDPTQIEWLKYNLFFVRELELRCQLM